MTAIKIQQKDGTWEYIRTVSDNPHSHTHNNKDVLDSLQVTSGVLTHQGAKVAYLTDIPVVPDVSTLTSNVNALQSTVNGMSTTISGLSTKVSNAENSVATLSGQVASINGAVANVSGGLSTVTNNISTINGEISDLKSSVSNGKNLLAMAITDKGIPTSAGDTFGTMAMNIQSISSGSGGNEIFTMEDVEEVIEDGWVATFPDTVKFLETDMDGYIYAMVEDKTIRKYAPDGTEEWAFLGHTTFINGMAVDIAGNVYTTSGNVVRKINRNGELVWSVSPVVYTFRGVAVDINLNVYVTASNGYVYKLNPFGEIVWVFSGHTSSFVYTVAVDKNGIVYSGSWDKTLRKINTSGLQVWSFTGVEDYVNIVRVDNQGDIYATGYSSKRVVVKVNPQAEELWRYTTHTATINDIKLDAKGNLYTASTDRTTRKVNKDGIELNNLIFNTISSVPYAIAIDPEGSLYRGGGDKKIVQLKLRGYQFKPKN